MDSSDIDKLAYALLTSIKWAIDGGKVEELPRVHEMLSDALDIVLVKKVTTEISSLKARRDASILDILQKNHGHITRTAKELGVSRWTIERCIGKRKELS